MDILKLREDTIIPDVTKNMNIFWNIFFQHTFDVH